MNKMIFMFSMLLILTSETKAMQNDNQTNQSAIVTTAAIAIAHKKAENTTPPTSAASSFADYSDYPNGQRQLKNYSSQDDLNKYPYYSDFPGAGYNPETNR